MPQTDKLKGLFQPALGVYLLLACAASHAQGAGQEEDGTIKNPKECLQTELVWAKDDNSTANSLVSDYFFTYPEGIRLTNRCDETVSTRLGADAVLGGIVEEMTSPGGDITNVELTSEEVLECEGFSTFLFGGATEVLEFPEWVRETAEEYHYERARHLANYPDKPDYWEHLGWRQVRYKGCAEWSDARLKIGTGYRHTCPVGICPGEAFTVTADYFFSGEVVQTVQDGGSEQQAAAQEKSLEQVALERQLAGEMVSIPAGSFRMGDLSGEGYDDEKPVRTVTVPAFRLGKHEVTFAQWDACVADGGCNGYPPDDWGWGRGDRPVINVSWDDVQLFIDWLNRKTGGNYRLPSEAEWEYAARAGSRTKYSWGDDIGNNRANCDGCGSQWDDKRTAPVGSFPANAWGLHDMHGNVQEWVQDCRNDSYEGAPDDGSAWTSGDCSQRMIRGASWNSNPEHLRSANRNSARPYRDSGQGVRLAHDE